MQRAVGARGARRPCWPAIGSASPRNRRSASAIERPVMSATRAAEAPRERRQQRGDAGVDAARRRAWARARAACRRCRGRARIRRAAAGGGPRRPLARRARSTSRTAVGRCVAISHDVADALGGAEAPALAQHGGIEQHASRPAIDVELAHDAAHEAHPVALLVRGHRQRDLQRRRALVGIVGIDDQRFREFARRARRTGTGSARPARRRAPRRTPSRRDSSRRAGC